MLYNVKCKPISLNRTRKHALQSEIETSHYLVWGLCLILWSNASSASHIKLWGNGLFKHQLWRSEYILRDLVGHIVQLIFQIKFPHILRGLTQSPHKCNGITVDFNLDACLILFTLYLRYRSRMSCKGVKSVYSQSVNWKNGLSLWRLYLAKFSF